MVLRALAVAASLLALAGGDWPEFRGPTGQGLAAAGDDPPVEWGPDKNVAWKRAVPGKGWSTPVVRDGRVYLTTAVPQGDADQSLRVLAFDTRTGEPAWDTEVFRQDGKTAPAIYPKNSHASASPVADGRRVYAHFGHQGTAALNLDGTVAWRHQGLPYQPVHGNGGSPVLLGDSLIYSADGADRQFVAALDAATGKPRWSIDRKTDAAKRFSFGTPLVVPTGGRDLVVSQGSNALCAYDPADGREVWRVRYQGYSVVPRPVFGHGLVLFSTGYDSPVVTAVRPDGQGDVTNSHVSWRLRKGAPANPSPLLVGDELYLMSDGGIASCVDARTGKVHWQERVGGAHSASPVFAAGRVYFLSEDGVGTVVRAGKKFAVLARNALKERTLASYAVADGALFVRTEGHLYRFAAVK